VLNSLTLGYDDILSAIKGISTNSARPPYSLWKHFPKEDRSVDGMIKSHLQFQEKFHSDIMKISPHARFCLVDFGCSVSNHFDPITGANYVTKHAVNAIHDWENIIEVDPLDGELGQQLKAYEKIVSRLENSKQPILTMATVFLPFMVADKLVKDNKLIEHLKEDPQLVKDRLKIIAKTTLEYAKASLDTGINGLFLATQHAQKKLVSEHEWIKLIYPVDNFLVSNIEKAEFTVLHLHGKDLFFDAILNKLNVSAVNWHTEDEKPSIADCKFNGGLLGGLHETKLSSNEEEIKSHLQNILKKAKTNASRLIIAPGCVLPLQLTDAILEIVVKKIKLLKY